MCQSCFKLCIIFIELWYLNFRQGLEQLKLNCLYSNDGNFCKTVIPTVSQKISCILRDTMWKTCHAKWKSYKRPTSVQVGWCPQIHLWWRIPSPCRTNQMLQIRLESKTRMWRWRGLWKPDRCVCYRVLFFCLPVASTHYSVVTCMLGLQRTHACYHTRFPLEQQDYLQAKIFSNLKKWLSSIVMKDIRPLHSKREILSTAE